MYICLNRSAVIILLMSSIYGIASRQVTLARLPDTVIHPAYTTVAGLLANVYRVGLMAGARLEALVVTLLCPRGAVNGRFLASSVMAAAGQVWRHVHKLWAVDKGASSPFTKDTVLIAYTGQSPLCSFYGGLYRVECTPYILISIHHS